MFVLITRSILPSSVSNTPFPPLLLWFFFNATHWIYLCLLAWASVGSSLLSVNRGCTIALKKMINPSPEPRNCVSPLSERCSLRVLCALHDGQCTMVSRFSAGTCSYMEGVYECCSLARPWRHHFADPLHSLALSFLLPCLCSLSFREGNVPFRVVHSTVPYSSPFDTCESLHYYCPLQRADSLREAESSTNPEI